MVKKVLLILIGREGFAGCKSAFALGGFGPKGCFKSSGEPVPQFPITDLWEVDRWPGDGFALLKQV